MEYQKKIKKKIRLIKDTIIMWLMIIVQANS